jgi:hypothetical protein
MHNNNFLYRKWTISLAFMTIFSFSNAQLAESDKFKKREKATNNAILINPSYAAQFPFEDLKKRFGFNSNVGMLIGLRTTYNFFIGVEGNYLFGNQVKENSILKDIITEDFQVITIEGKLITPRIRQEGFSVKAVGEKVFRIFPKLKGSGLYLQAGVGFIQHKILIQAPTRLVPQLDKTYRKGYDRMSNGALLSIGSGFKFLERKKLLRFNVGCHADFGFTPNRRAWNFDEGKSDNRKRLDIFVGVKFGWIIPILINKDNVDLY